MFVLWALTLILMTFDDFDDQVYSFTWTYASTTTTCSEFYFFVLIFPVSIPSTSHIVKHSVVFYSMQ